VLTLAPPAEEQLPPLLGTARKAPRVITAANAWLMDNIMGDVIKRGTGVRARVLGREDISGKTGTTNESHDTWFNGFNTSLEATVWVGYDQEQSLGEGEEGSSVAVPIWVRLMREGLRGVPDVPRPMPPGLVSARVDADRALAAANNSAAISEFFFTDKLPPAATGPGNPANAGPDRCFALHRHAAAIRPAARIYAEPSRRKRRGSWPSTGSRIFAPPSARPPSASGSPRRARCRAMPRSGPP
jgi:penicillin-binding protein 1A